MMAPRPCVHPNKSSICVGFLAHKPAAARGRCSRLTTSPPDAAAARSAQAVRKMTWNRAATGSRAEPGPAATSGRSARPVRHAAPGAAGRAAAGTRRGSDSARSCGMLRPYEPAPKATRPSQQRGVRSAQDYWQLALSVMSTGALRGRRARWRTDRDRRKFNTCVFVEGSAGVTGVTAAVVEP